MTRTLALCGAAFAAGFALTVAVIRGWEEFNDQLDNALRWGRA